MLFRMIRTQTGERGTYRSGVAYDAGKDAVVLKEVKAFIAAGFAEEVTAEQLKKEKTVAEKLSAASLRPSKSAKGSEAIRAAKDAETQALAAAEAARAAEAAAKEEVETLKAKIAELEAAVAAKGAAGQE